MNFIKNFFLKIKDYFFQRKLRKSVNLNELRNFVSCQLELEKLSLSDFDYKSVFNNDLPMTQDHYFNGGQHE